MSDTTPHPTEPDHPGLDPAEVPAKPGEVDPGTGTDPDDIPIDNPSG